MTANESERLARLEQKVEDLTDKLKENSVDTKAILARLDNLTGGKQALIWVVGTLIGIGTIIATWWGVRGK